MHHIKNNIIETFRTSGYFLLFLFLTSFLNILILRTSPEIIAYQFALLTLIFYYKRFLEFIWDWGLFLILFLLGEIVRGYCDNLNFYSQKVMFLIYNLESYLFHPLPTVYLQRHLADNGPVLNLTALFYSTFFYYTFVSAFILWVYRKKAFRVYAKWFLIMFYTGLAFFLLLPTAPPWYVEHLKHLGIERLLWTRSFFALIKDVSFYRYFVDYNLVAAFPSFHTAWPTFTSVFIYLMNKRLWFLGILPLGISFAVVYSGEHYLIDVIAGILMGVIFAFYTYKELQTGAADRI